MRRVAKPSSARPFRRKKASLFLLFVVLGIGYLVFLMSVDHSTFGGEEHPPQTEQGAAHSEKSPESSDKKLPTPATRAPDGIMEIYQVPLISRSIGNMLTGDAFERDSSIPRVLAPNFLRCPIPLQYLSSAESMYPSLNCTPVSLPENQTPIRLPDLWTENYFEKEKEKSEEDGGENSPCRSWDCPIREDCMANAEGYCYKSKDPLNVPNHPILQHKMDRHDVKRCHFRQPRGGGLHEELACAWTPDPDKPPPIPETIAGEDGSGATDSRPEAERTLQAFKNFTANSFQKWYDWGKLEEIVEMKTQEEREQFVVEGSHVEEKERVYMLKNICLRPTGALAGYHTSPLKTRIFDSTQGYQARHNIGPYHGGDDVSALRPFMIESKATHKATVEFFSNVEQLDEPPKFYMNRSLAIMPLTSRSNNPGHALQRLGGLLANIELAFGASSSPESCDERVSLRPQPHLEPLAMGNMARKDVTTVYAAIANEPGLAKFWNYCSPNCTFQDFAFKQYTTLATTSHFHIWNNASQAAAHLPWAHPSNFNNNNKDSARGFTPNNTMVCFKEAVVYQACHLDDCRNVRLLKFEDTPRHVFGLYFRRSAAVQQHLARRLRRCSGMHGKRANRKKSNAENPVVLYAFRDRSRGLSMGAYQVEQMLRVVKTNLNGSLVLSDMSRLTTWEMARLYSRADILIGPYGAGLYFLFMMPPGSVTLEVNSGAYRKSTTSGVDKNPDSDYGGMTQTAGMYHSVISFSGGIGRYPKGWIHVSPKVIERQLTRAACILRHHPSKGMLNKLCLPRNALRENRPLQDELLNDSEGLEIRRSVRALHSPSFSFPKPSIVHSIYSLSHLLGPQFRPQRDFVNRGVLIAIGDCGPKDYQYFYHFFMNFHSMAANLFWVVGTGADKASTPKSTKSDLALLDKGDEKAEDFNEAKGGGKTISSAVRIPPFKTHKDIVNDILYGDRMYPWKFHLCDTELNSVGEDHRPKSSYHANCSTGPYMSVIVTKKYLRSEGFARYLSRNAGGFTRSKFLQALHNEAEEPLSQTELNRLHEEGELNYDYALLVRELPLDRYQGSGNTKVFVLDDEEG